MKAALLAIALVACGSKDAATPAATPAAAAAAAGPKGRVESRLFKSDALGVDKLYWVYLPSGYDAKPGAKWPVFYYLHGLTGDEHSWLKGGHIDEAADALGLPAIIVMPDGDDGFYADAPQKPIDFDACMKDGTGLFAAAFKVPSKTCVKHFMYETYIVKDLIADVDAHYHTNATRDGRGIAGLSMGGLGALELGMRHPDVFAAAASHSGVVSLIYAGPHPFEPGKAQFITDVKQLWIGIGDIGQYVRGIYGTNIDTWLGYDPTTLAKKVEPGKPALYIDCGTEDEFHLNDNAQALHEILVARKIDHAFFIGPGHHNFEFWRPRVTESLKFLREHVAKS